MHGLWQKQRLIKRLVLIVDEGQKVGTVGSSMALDQDNLALLWVLSMVRPRPRRLIASYSPWACSDPQGSLGKERFLDILSAVILVNLNVPFSRHSSPATVAGKASWMW